MNTLKSRRFQALAREAKGKEQVGLNWLLWVSESKESARMTHRVVRFDSIGAQSGVKRKFKQEEEQRAGGGKWVNNEVKIDIQMDQERKGELLLERPLPYLLMRKKGAGRRKNTKG